MNTLLLLSLIILGLNSVHSESFFRTVVNSFQDTFYDVDYMIETVTSELQNCPEKIRNIKDRLFESNSMKGCQIDENSLEKYTNQDSGSKACTDEPFQDVILTSRTCLRKWEEFSESLGDCEKLESRLRQLKAKKRNEGISDSQKLQFTRKYNQDIENLGLKQHEHVGGGIMLASSSYNLHKGEKLPKPNEMGYKVNEGGIHEQILENKIKIHSIIGRGYNVEITMENKLGYDVKIKIPMGTVFEQDKWNMKQNLAIRKDFVVTMKKYQQETYVLGAFCLDQSYGLPNGEKMKVTPFKTMYVQTDTTQSDVWRIYSYEDKET